MFCSNCGGKIDDSSSFCKNCGAKITNNDKTERVQLKCKECGGVMTADSSNKTLHCPYCGSDEVIVYGDAVEVERIKNTESKKGSRRHSLRKLSTFQQFICHTLKQVLLQCHLNV